MSLIELRNVHKAYPLGETEVRALAGVDLDIAAGEFVAIIGPSGSGKSTLMHILGCLDTPSSGTVTIDGVPITRDSARELPRLRNQKIGFVFQFFNLLPKLNILQNVELPMAYAGVPAADRRARAKTALEMVGLGDRLHHRPGQLSGGQTQRAAIARAMINHPKILLADEPTGNLDTRTGETILELFQQLHRQGCTIAIVTHDAAIAAIAQRRIELRDGKIVSQPG